MFIALTLMSSVISDAPLRVHLYSYIPHATPESTKYLLAKYHDWYPNDHVEFSYANGDILYDT